MVRRWWGSVRFAAKCLRSQFPVCSAVIVHEDG
jgi:hypothetical protein